MVIAVHDNIEGTTNRKSDHEIFQQLIRKCVLNHPDATFCLIGPNAPTAEKFEKIKFIEVKEPRFPFLKKRRYWNKITNIVQDIQADRLISNDSRYCKKINIPKILIIHDHDELERTDIKDLNDTSVIVFTEATRTKLISILHADPDTIKNIHFGITETIQPLNYEEQFIVKEDNTEGKEYFLASYPNDKTLLINLLKAFSIFKKRQQTNMLLLLVAKADVSDEFHSIVKNYKYRTDVLLKFKYETQQGYNLLGAAYAYIDQSVEDLMKIAEAMKYAVPVITTEKARELTGDGALYVQAEDHLLMAEQLMLIYKDENLRMDVIKKAAAIACEFTWDRTEKLFWKAVIG